VLGALILSAAGKFLVQGPSEADAEERLRAVRRLIDDWLLRETRGEVRFALGVADSQSDVEAYRQAQRELQRAKARPWAPTLGSGWESNRLILRQLDMPCFLCGHAPATEDEPDQDTRESRRVCHWCWRTRLLGQQLPRARWLAVLDPAREGDLDLFGFGVTVSGDNSVAIGSETEVVAILAEPERRPDWCLDDRFLQRRLMAHTPLDKDGTPTWFVDLARQARGDHLLAVFKADADSLGLAIERLIASGSDLKPLREFSSALDGFFAARLKSEIESGRNPRWRLIYTILAGGDDLVMVGPWDVMTDFAGRVHELFQAEFGERGLTLSAGLALIKPKRPIKTAVAEAEQLLELAKLEPPTNPKDQLAAFGQVWKWRHHEAIMRSARQMVAWVEAGQMQRGWLHTLLALAEARHGAKPDLLATARLAHHVARNYRPNTPARRWADQLVERFDNPTHVEVRFLPAIVRYAVTATRTPGEEE
jgi:CRISPR-associated protein Csm1